jgi:hypothetical protein
MMPVFNHTPHTKKQIVEHVVASHATNIVPRANYRSIGPQNDPTFHEHVIQGLHVALGMVLLILAHLSTPIIRNYIPIGTISPYG